MIDRTTPIALTPTYRLQWEEAQDKHVLLYPEGMVELNPSAAEILSACENRSADEIIAALKEKFGDVDLDDDVLDFLRHAFEEGWIRHVARA